MGGIIIGRIQQEKTMRLALGGRRLVVGYDMVRGDMRLEPMTGTLRRIM